jgi:glycosyltransferase involved in cell wall biosynthesis
MLILFVFNSTMMGGANRSTIELLQEMKKKVDIVAVLPGQGTASEILHSMGVRYYIVPFQFSCIPVEQNIEEKSTEVFLDNVEAAKKIAELFQNERIQAIYTNSSTGDVGAILALLLEIPHIWHIREFLEEHYQIEFVDIELKINLFQSAEQCIAVSSCLGQKCRNWYKIEALCIHDGLDFQKPQLLLKDTLKGKDGKIHFLFAGGLVLTKGITDVLLAVKELKYQKCNNFVVHVIGDGSSLMNLVVNKFIHQFELDDYIEILPYCDDIKELRELSIIALTCSKMEALGRVTIEAMLAGRIVIGANTGGTLELIGEKEERGYLYQQGDGKDLAKTILRVLRMEYEKQYIKLRKIQKYAIENYDIQKYTATVLQSIRDCVDRFPTSIKQSAREELRNRILMKYERLRKDEKKISVLKQISNQRQMFYNSEQMCWQNWRERWRQCKDRGFRIESYLLERNIKRVALYGLGYLGMQIYKELEYSSVTVVFLLDKQFSLLSNELLTDELKKPEDAIVGIDALIITPAIYGKEIANHYDSDKGYKIIILREILENRLEKL